MNQHIEKLFAALRRGHKFVTHDVWHIGRPGEEAPKGFIIKNVRVVILLVGNLSRGTVMLRASALTFATILAIVPTLAILFYSVRTFHLDEAVFTMVQDQVEGTVQNVAEFFRGNDDNTGPTAEPVDVPPTDTSQAVVADSSTSFVDPPETTAPQEPALADDSHASTALQDELHRALFRDVTHQTDEQIDPVKEVFRLANDLADRAASDPSALFVSGIVLFLTTVLGLLRNIENAFNTIWGVRRTRPWYRMVGDYLLITILLPFVAAAVLGVNAALQSEEVLNRLGPLAVTVRATQYAVIWLIFTALYLVVPNTRVKTRYALLGGMVAGTLWVLLSWAYVQFQIGLTNYNLVFSTLAQVPMLLMWIYSSWMILLFGVELTHAYQNEHTFALERFAEDASFAYREAVALRAMVEIARRFDQGGPAFAPDSAAAELNVPSRLLNEALDALEAVGLVTACNTTPPTYQPARAIDRIRLADVSAALRDAGREPSLLREDDTVQQVLSLDANSTLAQALDRLPGPNTNVVEADFTREKRSSRD